MTSFCPSCNHPLLHIEEIGLNPTSCPYCDYDFSTNSPKNKEEKPKDETPADVLELIHRMQNIKCWYCQTSNPFSNDVCWKCDSELSIKTYTDSIDQNTAQKIVNQLTSEESDQCLILGIIAFLKAVMKREGYENGMFNCKHCGNKYNYKEFYCPTCNKETWLSEMREVLCGRLRNKSLIEEFQRSFPQFSIKKWTNSSLMRSDVISGTKSDLENIAKNCASILEAGGVYLKAYTSKPKSSQKGKRLVGHQSSQGISSLFDFDGVDIRPDNRVMDFLGSSTVHIDDDTPVNSDTPVDPEILNEDNSEEIEDVSDDLFSLS